MPTKVNTGFSRLTSQDQESLSRIYQDYNQLFSKYRELREDGMSYREALEELYRYAGVAKGNRGLVQRFISACSLKNS